MEFTPQAALTLTNSFALLISVNETADQVTYKYSDDEESLLHELHTSEIFYDQDGEPYFVTVTDGVYYLSQFMKIV
jgi:hypothetical protein